MRKKIFFYFSLLAILAIFSFIGSFYLGKSLKESSSDWKTYWSLISGITFNYPSDWEVKEIYLSDRRIEISIPYRPKGQNHDLKIRIYKWLYMPVPNLNQCEDGKEFFVGSCKNLQQQQFAGIDAYYYDFRASEETQKVIQIDKPGQELTMMITTCTYPGEFKCKEDVKKFLSSFQFIKIF